MSKIITNKIKRLRMGNNETIIYKVIDEAQPENPYHTAYIARQSTWRKIADLVEEESVHNAQPTTHHIPIEIESTTIPRDKHLLVHPVEYWDVGDTNIETVIAEWERRIATLIGEVKILGPILLSWDDIYAAESPFIHPAFDQRVISAIAKLESGQS